MKNISELKRILSIQLGWHKSRIDFFARALIGLFICRTINLREIAVAMPSKAMIDSRYKRIQRFFASFEMNYDVIARWIFKLFIPSDTKYYIAIDRTNWFWGKSKINIFMLSICYEGIAIPIYWKLLNKAGNSTGTEQIELLERFVNTFGSNEIAAVLADREFPNSQFIGWLTKKQIAFYMRIKYDAMIYFKKKKYKQVGSLFNGLQRSEQRVFDMSLPLFGQTLFLAASKNEKDELMIVATNANPKVAIATYLRRWEIECLFQALKNRGFRFEDTHVVNLERLEKITALLAIAFAWAHKTGEWRAVIKPIPMKTIKKQRRPLYSFFKYGLDYIRDKITGLSINNHQFKKLIAKLHPLPHHQEQLS